MIAATVGRIVWFKLNEQSVEVPAIVSRVHGPSMIDVTIFDGTNRMESSVPLLQEEDAPNKYGTRYCTWMPYQQAQVKKYPV